VARGDGHGQVAPDAGERHVAGVGPHRDGVVDVADVDVPGAGAHVDPADAAQGDVAGRIGAGDGDTGACSAGASTACGGGTGARGARASGTARRHVHLVAGAAVGAASGVEGEHRSVEAVGDAGRGDPVVHGPAQVDALDAGVGDDRHVPAP